MRRTKIVCTLGPACRQDSILRAMIGAGMDVARLNFSHGTRADHEADIRRVRSLADEAGRPIAVLADLQGPKLRTGEVRGGAVTLREGSAFTLTTQPTQGTEGMVSCSFADLPRAVRPGDTVLLADGELELRVQSVEDTAVHCIVIVGGILGNHKGINLPGVALEVPALTQKDRDDLAFALQHGVDYVALSFVRSADDVVKLKLAIREAGADTPVCAKIEKPQAVADLERIVDVSDAVMVARGDLGVELSPERVPILQKRIIRLANQRCVPAITATQMLESMIDNPRPTRAEASDVANAILDGTDAVMLSGETAVGRYPVEAVRMMDRIAIEAEASLTDGHRFMDAKLQAKNPLAAALTHGACQSADDLEAKGIIALTRSGYTALLVSKHRPRVPIVGATPSEAAYRRMALYWGVGPMVAAEPRNSDDVVKVSDQAAQRIRGIAEGDLVVTLSGAQVLDESTTHVLRLHRVGVSARADAVVEACARPVVVEDALCIGCGLCVAACRPQILEIAGAAARLIYPLAGLCDRDAACTNACPTGAISLARPEAGIETGGGNGY